MTFRLRIFIPNDTLYKEDEFEAENVLEAGNVAKEIFNEEFLNSGKKNGNFVIEQI